MKKHQLSLILLGTALSLAAMSSASAAVYSFNGLGLVIPDSGPAIPSTISVSGIPLSESVVSVTVTITDYSHTYSNDTVGTVTSAIAEVVTLWSQVGGSEDAVGSDWVFADTAGAGLASISQSGTFLPTGPALSTFNSDNPNGTWTLNVNDLFAQDQGTIGSWSLTITTIPEPAGAAFAGLIGLGSLVRRRRPATR